MATTKNKTVGETYQILSEVEHIRKRPGMYVGSVSQESDTQWVYDLGSGKMVKQPITYIPGFIKLFSEVLDNAIDESKRTKLLNTIKVEFQDDGTISIMDNGRGFPCEIHPDTGKYVAETVFTNLRAGSNFSDEDDQMLVGTNGLGAKLTCVLSKRFTIETADSTKLYKQTITDSMSVIGKPKITESTKHYTQISWLPDYEYFKMDGLDDDHILRMTKRVVDAAACNPNIKFYINGTRITVKSFSDYITMYLEDGEDMVYDTNGSWHVGVSKSHDGFDQVSFVNSVETYQGGEHVKYASNQIVDAVRAFIKKKHKIDVTPGDIRNHLRIYISCDINRPRFSSQTKENMVSTASEWKTSWSVPEKFITKLVKTDIIQRILDWAEAKANAAEAAELRRAGKEQSKVDPRRVPKFSDATERVERYKCILAITEGDSAAKSVIGGRGSNPYIGSFPMKGKIMNVRDKDASKILGLDKKKEKESAGKKVEPNELQNIMTILGLQIGKKVEFIEVDGVLYPDLRFGKLVITTDSDPDGQHISGLVINFIDKFWPELLEHGFIHILRTPVVLVTLKDKSELEFFTEAEYRVWETNEGVNLKGWTMKYYKGLSTWETSQFAHFLNNLGRYLFQVTCEDADDLDAIDLAFNVKRADDRKAWIETPAGDFAAYIIVE